MRAQFQPHQPREGEHAFDLVQVQDALRRWTEDFYRQYPKADGALIEGVKLITGENLVEHKLGRALRGWEKWRDSVEPVAFSSYLLSDQTGIPSGSNTGIGFDTLHHQLGAAFDDSTHIFTAPHRGLYEFFADIDIEFVADQTRLFVFLMVNETIARQNPEGRSSGVDQFHGGQVTASLFLEAGDAVSVAINHDHGSDRTIDGGIEDSTFAGRALTGLVDQQISHDDTTRTLRIHSECDRTVDLWVF